MVAASLGAPWDAIVGYVVLATICAVIALLVMNRTGNIPGCLLLFLLPAIAVIGLGVMAWALVADFLERRRSPVSSPVPPAAPTRNATASLAATAAQVPVPLAPARASHSSQAVPCAYCGSTVPPGQRRVRLTREQALARERLFMTYLVIEALYFCGDCADEHGQHVPEDWQLDHESDGDIDELEELDDLETIEEYEALEAEYDAWEDDADGGFADGQW